jgi:hypothetical protein
VCAYNTVISVPAPAGFSGTLTGTFPTINPGATTAQTCANFVVLPDADTNLCRSFVPTGQLGTDADFAIGRETATTNAATPQFCIAAPSATARLTATGDSCTQSALNTPTIADVQVGELVTYTIVVRLPEGVASPLTPQIVFDSRTTLVAGTPTVARVGSSLTAGTPSVSASGTTVSWTFGSVSNTANNVANVEDEITLTVQARVLTAATLGAVLTPTVTLVHAGSTLTAASAAMQAEVVEPVVTRSSTITPASGAYGDPVQVSFTVQQASSSSRCTYGIEVCDTPNQMQFNPATVVISGITPTPTIRTTSTGFCFTVPTARPRQ